MRAEDSGRNIQGQLRQQVVPERIADAVGADMGTPVPGKEEASAGADTALGFTLCQIATQPGSQLGAEWHQPVLAELSIADLQNFAFQVDVTALKAGHFADTQA